MATCVTCGKNRTADELPHEGARCRYCREAETGVKHCSKCGQDLPLSEFHLSTARAHIHGRQSWCKDCLRAYVRGYYQANADKKRAYEREYTRRKRVEALDLRSEPA